MSNLPDPPIPAETDIRDLDGFMLNTERLLASELWALSTGEEFKAAMGLWCRAWKQTPPGSLPDDDRVLAAFSGAGARWKKVREMATRGFVKCSDGRLYHKVLCEDVARAAQKKAERRDRTKAATEARRAQRDVQRDDDRNDERNDERHVERNDPQTRNVTTSHRQDRDGTGIEDTPSLRSGGEPEPGELPLGDDAPDSEAAKPASRKVSSLADLTLDDEMREWVAKTCPLVADPAAEVEKFRDWCRAKGQRQKDYRAGFRNWLRKAQEIATDRVLDIPPYLRRGSAGNGKPPTVDAYLAMTTEDRLSKLTAEQRIALNGQLTPKQRAQLEAAHAR